MMLKPILILGVFGAGVALGAIAMRNFDRPSVATAPAALAGGESMAPASAIAVEAPDSKTPATPLSAVSIPAAAANSAMPTPPALANTAAPMPPVDAGATLQPIDAGEVFNKILARPSQAGFENQIGDAHRALERELRDEGWANTMEAELQNAMINEVSTGSFKAEYIECRATMCEVRLSGSGPQGAAIKTWHDGLMGQPFGQRLFLNYGSAITNNDQTDMLMIFRKPPPPGSTPPQAPQKVSQQRQAS